MERCQCINLRDVVDNCGKTRLGFALDFLDVIGEFRAHELGNQHVEAVSFGVSQQRNRRTLLVGANAFSPRVTEYVQDCAGVHAKYGIDRGQ